MSILTEEEKQQIRAAIEKAESRTAGEFVTVIARKSDEYRFIPLLWASSFALALPALFIPVAAYFYPHLTFSLDVLYLGQVGVFLLLALLFQNEKLRMALVPAQVKKERASKLAHMMFLKEGIHRTRDRTGVLLFVSFAERYVEIIADAEINNKVEAGYWQQVVDGFLEKVKQNRVAGGFIGAIEGCCEPLTVYFPVKDDDTNELTDRLIEI